MGAITLYRDLIDRANAEDSYSLVHHSFGVRWFIQLFHNMNLEQTGSIVSNGTDVPYVTRQLTDIVHFLLAVDRTGDDVDLLRELMLALHQKNATDLLPSGLCRFLSNLYF